jgi:hypothetical protein
MAGVITYTYPGSGTTPATAAQASACSVQTMSVLFVDTDTVASIVHNWVFDTTALARGLPFSDLEQITGGTASPILQITKSTNGFQIAKPSWLASGGTLQVTLQRPHSILMPNI